MSHLSEMAISQERRREIKPFPSCNATMVDARYGRTMSFQLILIYRYKNMKMGYFSTTKMKGTVGFAKTFFSLQLRYTFYLGRQFVLIIISDKECPSLKISLFFSNTQKKIKPYRIRLSKAMRKARSSTLTDIFRKSTE